MILLKELSEHYAALLKGQSVALPPPPQYAEYVRWQESLIASGAEERLKYWREWFSRGEPPSWQWALSKSTPATPGFGTHVVWQRYSPELTSQLKSLARSSGGTIFLTLLTVYALVLTRYTVCDDLTLGTTYSNRHQSRFASLIGTTIDVPALRVDMTDNPTVLTLLARTRMVVAEALTWQDVPFENVAPRLERKASGPLFRMVFSFFGEVPHGKLRLPGVDVEFLEEMINGVSRPDLYLVFWENQSSSGETLTGYWMHKRAVFELETAEKMNREFQTLIAAIIQDPTQRVRTLLSSLQ
jgi:non-ribosomal peptide synthetase component F